jgi:hypothetical protein
VLNLQQLLERHRPEPILLLVSKRQWAEIVLAQRGREDEFCVRLVLDEAGRREALDGLVSVAVALTAPAAVGSAIFLHAAPATTVRLCFATPCLDTEALCGVQDRPVSGTSAEVAIEGLLDVQLGWCVGVAQKRIQAHDDAGSAETALAAIALCNALLCGVRPLDIADAFDCDDMLTVDADERGKTGVYGGVVDFGGCGVELRHNLGLSVHPRCSTQKNRNIPRYTHHTHPQHTPTLSPSTQYPSGTRAA